MKTAIRNGALDSLFVFAILILGCGNQNPVSEPKEDTLPPYTKAFLSISEPAIVTGSVADGDVDVDPEPLNRDGIWFTFDEPISISHFNLRLEAGPTLGWMAQWSADGLTVTLTPSNLCSLLRNSNTYAIDFVVRDFGCWKSEGTITFHTKE